MDPHSLQTIRATFAASDAGRLHFGQMIGQLVVAGVHSYHVDYRAGRTTCHLAGDEVVDVDAERPREPIGARFDGDALREAIRGAQQGTVMYPEFKRLSQRAGCAGYTVWIAGRHVTYFGRNGETHVERFPD